MNELPFDDWHKAFQSPRWYEVLVPEWRRIEDELKTFPESERRVVKDKVYEFVESELRAGAISLGTTGPNQDLERKPIDTAIIHHTSGESGITWQRLSAMHLMRLYAPRYLYVNETVDIHRTGDPIYSHHFRPDGTQVFYGYHWLIRTDGSTERLLPDNEIGWQAGNWEVNCRSIGICLDGDFGHSTPPTIMLNATKLLLQEQYPFISHDRILGHREVNPKTTCPGDQFLAGWKNALQP